MILYFLWIFYSSHYSESKLLSVNYGTCLEKTERAIWNRTIFEDNDNVIIESTRRPSHKIVSYIIGILVKERLGYSNLRIRETDWIDATESFTRLTCNKAPCYKNRPVSHINMEVWMPPGFTSLEWVNHNLIVDCGPLGPSARTGIYYFNNRSISTKFHDWRMLIVQDESENITSKENPIPSKFYQIFSLCNESTNEWCKTKFAIDSELPPRYAASINRLYKNWTVQDTLADVNSQFYYSWYPNIMTVSNHYQRILLPDCNDPFTIDRGILTCEESINQMAKVLWGQLKQLAPLIYNLIDSFTLEHEQLLNLLQDVNVSLPNIDQEYFNVACQWVLQNKLIWHQMTVGWNMTRYLKVIILLPRFQGDLLPVEMEALNQSLQSLNRDYFSSMQYQIRVSFTYTDCRMLSDYFQAIYKDGSLQKEPIVGVLSGLSSHCMDTVSKFTTAERIVLISFRHQTLPTLLRNRYSLVFQTIPQIEAYYTVLTKFSKHYGWTRNVIISDHKSTRGLTTDFILKMISTEQFNTEYFYKVLEEQKLKENAKIFIVHIESDILFSVLCAAGKLEMTLKNRYVWMLNKLYNGTSEIPPMYHHCSKYINRILLDYFYLSVYEPGIASSCKHHSAIGLQQALTILGKVAYNITNTKSIITTFDPDILFDKTNKSMVSESYCLHTLFTHYRVTMEQNSLFWKYWYLYHVQNFNMNLVFVYEIATKYDLLDPITIRSTRKTNEINWETEIPDNGLNIEVSYCWANFLTSRLKIKCQTAVALFSVLVALICLIFLICILVLIYSHQYRKKVNPMKTTFRDLIQDLMDIDVQSSRLFLNHVIGKGAFGMVYGGEAENNGGVLQAVAVKTISESSDWKEKIDFLTEAKIMRKLQHSNIVSLIGVCLDSSTQLIFLIMELMEEGDLRNYLLSRRSHVASLPENSSELTDLMVRLTRFAKDVAEALGYMHSKQIIHRDVASRNCLLNNDLKIKLGDFGLAKRLLPSANKGFTKCETNVTLPFRWMPPEAIQFGLFSTKSDIWSFGILLFEIVTFGVCPYQDFTSHRNLELLELIKQGQITILTYLPKTANNSVLYRLVSQCCANVPNDRPNSMEQIISLLKMSDTCIRPYLTDEPPKSAATDELDNLSERSKFNPIVFDEGEIPVTTPKILNQTSSQKYINLVSKAFGKKSSFKDKHSYSSRNLRACQSSMSISKYNLITEPIDFTSVRKAPDLFIGSIPTDLGKKRIRSQVFPLNNLLKKY